MKSAINTVFAAIAALAVLAAPAAAQQTVTVTHAQGTTDVAVNPQTILTFDIAALDVLEALGVEVTGVPTTNMPAHLKKYEGEAFEKIGSLFEPDYEAVNALQPDLIIVAGRSAGVYPELAKIAPTVDLSNNWATFEQSIVTNGRILGEITGKTAEIEEMIARLETAKTEARAATANAGTGLVVLTSGGEITAYGPGSRFGWIFDTTGVTPAAKVAGTAANGAPAPHGDAISNEFILETNPGWLYVIDRDAATGGNSEAAKQVLDNELVAQTKAWSNGHVVYLDPVAAYVINGGLPAFTALVEQVGEAVSGH